MRNKQKKAWLCILSLVGLFAPFSNSANADNTNNNLLTIEVPQIAPTGAFLVSNEEKLEKYENATSLTDRELKNLLHLVGFKGQKLKEAWAIAKKESNGRPFAFNGNTETGDTSFGIFQINMLGMLGPDRRDKYELDHNADLFNPVINARIAFKMSRGGEDWSSWKGITPRTREWIEKFPS